MIEVTDAKQLIEIFGTPDFDPLNYAHLLDNPLIEGPLDPNEEDNYDPAWSYNLDQLESEWIGRKPPEPIVNWKEEGF